MFRLKTISSRWSQCKKRIGGTKKSFIPTWLRRCPRYLEVSFYDIYANVDHLWKSNQIRARSSYACWSLFCRRFVDILQSFSCIFRIRDGNDLSQFGRTEVNETQGYATCRYQLFTIVVVTPTRINYRGGYHSIVCHHLWRNNRTSTPE